MAGIQAHKGLGIARSAEAVRPTICFTQISAHKRAQSGAQVNTHVENRVRTIAADIRARIKLANDYGDIGLQKA